MEQAKDFIVQRLGDCAVPFPMRCVRFTTDEEHILFHSDVGEIRRCLDAGSDPPRFEAAGPRENIFFEPSTLSCGIVTCGGVDTKVENALPKGAGLTAKYFCNRNCYVYQIAAVPKIDSV